MKKEQPVIAVTVLLCLVAGVVWADGGNNTTTNKMASVTKAGGQNGPWTISASGTVSLDKTVQKFNGLQFKVTDPNGVVTNGFVSLPNGDPTPGGAAVAWNGTTNAVLKVQGNYSVVCIMLYVDGNGNPQTISSTLNINLP